jgi:hypothetical protein
MNLKLLTKEQKNVMQEAQNGMSYFARGDTVRQDFVI